MILTERLANRQVFFSPRLFRHHLVDLYNLVIKEQLS